MAKRELAVEMLLDDGEMRTRGCKTLKRTLLERTRNAAGRRQNSNSCSQDLVEAQLEDFVAAE